MGRFKIDLRENYCTCPVGLYCRDKTWFGREYWRQIDYFPDVKSAKEVYEQIKDLPQYLD